MKGYKNIVAGQDRTKDAESIYISIDSPSF